MNNQLRPPDPGELEVSLFGPGFGEAIVIHLGDRHWVIIDSCIEPTSRTPAALHYLHAINVDIATAVKLIVATHWHDDHIRGIGTVLRRCSAARIAVSTALRTSEFLRMVNLYHGLGTAQSSGLTEFSEVFRVLNERKQKQAKVNSAALAIANRRLYHTILNLEDQEFAANVYALSPSDATVTLATLAFAELWSQDEVPRKRLLSPTSNHASVALWCEVGSHTCLLGADLERTNDPEMGWAAVLDRSTVIAGQAGVFKVAHHGGASGHEPRVWSELLIPQPYAVLTPYARGSKHLPTEGDIERITGLTKHAYITAPPARGRQRWTNPVVRSMVRNATKEIHNVHATWGHLRLRCNIAAPSNSWQVELFGRACSLQDISAQ